MAELRWILLGLGALFCLSLWAWETRRRRQASRSLREFETDAHYEETPPAPRMEPTFGEAVAVQEDLPAMEGDEALPAEEMIPDEIVSLRLLSAADKPFEGGELVRALHAAGLEHGKFAIFHKYDIDGRTLFSVASLVEPGSFDLQNIDGRPFRGIVFFTQPKASGEAGLLAMKLAAQDLANRLQGRLQEETRNR